jgi:CRISPR-associated protein Cmr4
MGAGSAVGAIDNPIQREVHTQHPVFSGSGIKGALRHHFNRAWPRDNGKPDKSIERIFGPDTDASDFAGALSLTDAHLVALPIRSLKSAYAYVTCPLALARLKRFAGLAELEANWAIPSAPESQALTAGKGLLANGRLILEAFEFSAQEDGGVSDIARWLADTIFGNGGNFFATKLKSDLAVLSDTDFSHFARHAMVVEPHVRIDDESGTADDGGLFYTENLPPESILAGLAQSSVQRSKRGEKTNGTMKAEEILQAVFDAQQRDRPGISGKALQMGGDATTGRGLVAVRAINKKEN